MDKEAREFSKNFNKSWNKAHGIENRTEENMEKEFKSLSEKIGMNMQPLAIHKDDVKEFIKITLEIVSNPELSVLQKKAKIKQKAGNKLI